MPYNANQNELEILKFWEEKKIFEKSVADRPENKPYVFYDGPPFATGLPHYGHIVASLMKDVVPRFWTMRGYRVERKWGWDCHGLPIENIIEDKLKLKSKQDIEKLGIENFNEECRNTVLTYVEEWKKTIRRMGRWVDVENAYKTMDVSFMESVWWVFKQLWDKGLIYQGHKSMHICPRCETPLSNFEVTQNYKEIEDLSVTVKFKVALQASSRAERSGVEGSRAIKDEILRYAQNDNLYTLAWTTTPWTLPGNTLLAVNKNIKYLILNIIGKDEFYIVAKERVGAVMGDRKYKIEKEIKGRDLVGLEYEPLFPYFVDTNNAFRVVDGDFVSTTEGTGIVHIAPAFGEDDYNLGQREKAPLIQHVAMDGRFVSEVKDFAGWEVKPKNAPSKTDEAVVAFLEGRGKIFSKEKIVHSYPHCWRCDTPLLNYAAVSWFVKVADLKKDLLKNNEPIRWVPAHMKEGRFGDWLKGARDWAISRSRFWGTPLPVWENEDGGVVCVGSAAELEKLTGEKIKDLHKHKIDNLEIKKDGKVYHRIPEVLDCWFESGSMPYAQFHYPFENKKKFEDGFPAEFIAEGQDQTRGWFYTMHVLATALTAGKKPSIPVKKSSSSFKNVIVNGIVLAEDGKKMSKRLKNYPEPELILEKYGADALRYYFLTSPVMEAENLNFSEAGVREMYNKLINTLWNVAEFYKLYAQDVILSGAKDPLIPAKCGVRMTENVLDRWILVKLNLLIKDVTKGMEEYKLVEASRPLLDFIADLSQWWLRRSRNRFKGDDEADRQAALITLREVLSTLSKLMAPFTPFMAEKIYLELDGKKESVHLEDWPAFAKATAGKPEDDEKILSDMAKVRKIVEMGLAIRAEKGIKVRQPLSSLQVAGSKLSEEYCQIISDELNVKEVKMKNGEGGLKVILNTELTPELKKEGLAREIIRAINQMRKDKGLTIKDRVAVKYQTEDKLLREVFMEFGEEIKKSVLAETLAEGEGEEVEIEGKKIRLKLEKV